MDAGDGEGLKMSQRKHKTASGQRLVRQESRNGAQGIEAGSPSESDAMHGNNSSHVQALKLGMGLACGQRRS